MLWKENKFYTKQEKFIVIVLMSDGNQILTCLNCYTEIKFKKFISLCFFLIMDTFLN